MGLGGVTSVFTGKEDNKLLEEAGRLRDKQPVVGRDLPRPGLQVKIDLQDLVKQSEKSEKGILSSYTQQDLLQKFFWFVIRFCLKWNKVLSISISSGIKV